MSKLSTIEDAWQRRATEAAIAAVRKVVAGANLPAMTPIGKLSDHQWGWIVTAAIFGWIQVRCEQAIGEGLDQEQTVRDTGLKPSPCDVAAVTAILPTLADTAGVDWEQPLKSWSKDEMTNFLLRATRLITDAASARDSGKILRKPEVEFDDRIPF